MIALACPHCGDTQKVIKKGVNTSKTPRCQCNACNKTFTLNPKTRKTSPEREAQVKAALAERISQRGIARMMGIGRMKIREIRKKMLTE